MSHEVDEIKSKIDVVELIGGYIKVIQAGANFKALCPFHNEKTPSMMINRQKQIWKCFGCGEGGDIFSFIMKMENVDFPEALKILAQRAGVVLSSSNPQETSQKGRLFDLNLLSARYWHKILLESSRAKDALDYLKGRGLSEEAIEDFKIGYSIDSWDDLLRLLDKKGFNYKDALAAGVSVKKENGPGSYDRFRGRIMFPIFDLSGRVVGFGGRTMDKNESAKYINTPQTLIYNKSLILYGLYQAKEAIKQADACVLVEGYMDVIPSHQAGVKNVISISGTALTEGQIKILKRYTNNLILALDMDDAGRKAAERSIDLALAEEMNVKVVSLPQGKDPGECVQNNPADWKKAIESAQPVMEYFLGRAFIGRRPDDPQDKKDIANFVLSKIAMIGNLVERDFWLKKLAQDLSITEAVLREEMVKQGSKSKRLHSGVSDDGHVRKVTPAMPKDFSLLQRIIALALVFPSQSEKIVKNLSDNFFANNSAKTLYKSFVLFYTKNSDFFSKSVVDNFKQQADLFDLFKNFLKNKDLSKEVETFLDDAFLLGQKDFADLSASDAESEAKNLINQIKDFYFKNQIEILRSDLQSAEEAQKKDPDNQELKNKIEGLSVEIAELVKQKGRELH